MCTGLVRISALDSLCLHISLGYRFVIAHTANNWPLSHLVFGCERRHVQGCMTGLCAKGMQLFVSTFEDAIISLRTIEIHNIWCVHVMLIVIRASSRKVLTRESNRSRLVLYNTQLKTLPDPLNAEPTSTHTMLQSTRSARRIAGRKQWRHYLMRRRKHRDVNVRAATRQNCLLVVGHLAARHLMVVAQNVHLPDRVQQQ